MLDPVEFGKAMAAIVRDATAPLLKRIEELEAREPTKGDPGEKGADGADGKDAAPVAVSDIVKELLSTDAVQQIVGLEVASYLEENPPAPGKDGKDGEDGDPGIKGDDGKSVTIEDVSLFLDAAIAKHVLDLERRATDTLAKAIDKIPTPKDGKDGADYSKAEIDWEDERTMIVRGTGGEIRKRFPIPLDAGYWREGAYEKADIVTHDGNAWIALRDTKAKPSHDNKEDWRLFARKGRDGRDGQDGKPPPGPVKLHD